MIQLSLIRLGSLSYAFTLLAFIIVGIALIFILRDATQQSNQQYGAFVTKTIAAKLTSHVMPMYLPLGKVDLAEMHWSAGLSTMLVDDKNIEDVLKRAEGVLKQAKEAGGNQFWLDR